MTGWNVRLSIYLVDCSLVKFKIYESDVVWKYFRKEIWLYAGKSHLFPVTFRGWVEGGPYPPPTNERGWKELISWSPARFYIVFCMSILLLIRTWTNSRCCACVSFNALSILGKLSRPFLCTVTKRVSYNIGALKLSPAARFSAHFGDKTPHISSLWAPVQYWKLCLPF